MAEHHWYHAAELPARSHFPLFEAPGQAEEEIEQFAVRVGGRHATAAPPDAASGVASLTRATGSASHSAIRAHATATIGGETKVRGALCTVSKEKR